MTPMMMVVVVEVWEGSMFIRDVEPELFQGNSVQKKLGICVCVSRAFRTREIVWEGFKVMVIKPATGVNNFDQGGTRTCSNDGKKSRLIVCGYKYGNPTAIFFLVAYYRLLNNFK